MKAPLTRRVNHSPLQKTAAALPATCPIAPITKSTLSIQCKPGCACGGECPDCQEDLEDVDIQNKLAISMPGDPFEQEADRVADQVMRMPGPQVQRGCSCGGSCPTCVSEADEVVQTSSRTVTEHSPDVPPVLHKVLASPG